MDHFLAKPPFLAEGKNLPYFYYFFTSLVKRGYIVKSGPFQVKALVRAHFEWTTWVVHGPLFWSKVNKRLTKG
nr:MAG TPA: hypothetical protein [Caudoviricetes sp.]